MMPKGFASMHCNNVRLQDTEMWPVDLLVRHAVDTLLLRVYASLDDVLSRWLCIFVGW